MLKLQCKFIINYNFQCIWAYWLPIKQRIIYKICIIVYKCLHNSAPADIPSLLHFASNKCTRLKVTFNQRKVSDGAFSIYAPKLWNS